MSGPVSIRRLRPGEGRGLEAMTFPAYRHMLEMNRCPRLPNENQTEIVDPLVVVASHEGVAAGLAVADLPIEPSAPARLLSVFVVPELRRRGIGALLVEAVEEMLAETGRDRLETIYTVGKPAISWMERIFDRRGWSEPQTRMISIRLDVVLAKTAAWPWRQRLPRGWEIFEWKDLTDDERRRIRETNRQERWIPPDLEPWRHDSGGFEPRTSLGIRKDGEIVGWNIAHLMPDGTLRFTCSFIRKPLGRRGRILPLYTESFRRMIEAGLRYATLTVPLHHEGMAAFSKRWIGPWSSFIGETRGRERDLSEVRMGAGRPTGFEGAGRGQIDQEE